MKFNVTTVALITLSGLNAVAQDVPRADVFLGYSFLRANSAQTIPAFTANGGLFNFGLNFNNHIALEAEFGGYHNGNISGKQLDTTSYSYLFGPRFSLGRSRTVDPYIHVLFGVNRAATSISASSVLIPTPLPTTTTDGRYAASQANFAMAAGGGLDVKLSRHVLLRPIQLDYYLTRFETPSILDPTGGTSNRNQHDLRFAAGLAFSFGGERPVPPAPPPPPKMKNCPGGTSIPIDAACPKLTMALRIGISPDSVCPGDTAQVTVSGNLPDNAITKWTLAGETISQSRSFQFGATGRQPGPYKIELTASGDGFEDGSATATATVRPYGPPSGTLTVTPAEIYLGQKADLVTNFTAGQCGGPLAGPSFTAAEGSIQGRQFDSTGVRFDPPGATEQRRTITITAKVSDPKGTGSAEGSVVVKQRAALGPQRLPDLVFAEGNDRVNNCGKRVLLEDLKNLFTADAGGMVVFVGHVAQSELKSVGLDLTRAMNAAAVISGGTGVCTKFPASQILVKGVGATDDGVDYQPYFCAASATPEKPGQAVPQSEQAKYRRVEVWFVPSNGVLPAMAGDAKTAQMLGVSTLGCPR
jgi:Outer membrane protein beta-barrel domain